MKKRCKKCGMFRSEKDLVHLDEGSYLCFHCWNQLNIPDSKETD
ncbi:MAG: hypothetical protein ACOC44_11805 [Promethearchaeia archaeon]